MALELHHIIARSQSLVAAPMDDEIVMMNIERGEYLGLDSLASKIWEMTETPIKISDICERLLALYDVEHEQCEQDVLVFVNRLQELNVIHGADTNSESHA